MSFPNAGDLVNPGLEHLPGRCGLVRRAASGSGSSTWTWSGKDRRHLPDEVGRNVEDFAGIAQESNGPIPLFLLLFYLVVSLFIIGYPAVTLIFNYNY